MHPAGAQNGPQGRDDAYANDHGPSCTTPEIVMSLHPLIGPSPRNLPGKNRSEGASWFSVLFLRCGFQAALCIQSNRFVHASAGREVSGLPLACAGTRRPYDEVCASFRAATARASGPQCSRRAARRNCQVARVQWVVGRPLTRGGSKAGALIRWICSGSNGARPGSWRTFFSWARPITLLASTRMPSVLALAPFMWNSEQCRLRALAHPPRDRPSSPDRIHGSASELDAHLIFPGTLVRGE